MKGTGKQSAITGVYGWQEQVEENKLIELAQQNDGACHIVELGGEYGRSAAAFAYAHRKNPLATIWTVDKFPSDHHIVGDLLSAWSSNVNEAKLRWGQSRDEPPYNIPIISISWQGVDIWKRNPRNIRGIIDLLFIDAGHTYEAVCKDIDAWTPYANTVVFHDYGKLPNQHPLHFEVKRAVDEKMDANTWQRYDAPYTLVYFERREPLQTDDDTQPVTVTQTSTVINKSTSYEAIDATSGAIREAKKAGITPEQLFKLSDKNGRLSVYDVRDYIDKVQNGK